MRFKNRNCTGNQKFVTQQNPIIQSAPPISAFSRTDEQYFVDAVSMKPVIFVENTVASKQALSR
jgi:hypothetical protein